jgi:DNA-binding transcriptional LysR family regulator
MSDRLQELTVFVRAAESSSFSRTARDLGLSQPSISRIVSELEQRLGVRLLLRTTRRVVPTEAGTIFLHRARQVLHELEEAEAAARGADSLRGIIRVAMSATFGTREVIPILPPFLAAHPHLRVELMMSERRQDLVMDGVDVAIRLGRLENSGFGARRLATGQRLIIAAPAYLEARGTPVTPVELLTHDCIFGLSGPTGQSWTFERDGTAVSVEVGGRVRVDSAEGVVACVKAGLGIAAASRWMCRLELEAGDVVPLLTDHGLDPIDVHAVFPAGPHPSPKVRALVDHLVAALQRRLPLPDVGTLPRAPLEWG